MSISNLRAASVMAVFLACIPAPTLAQALDLGFHYNLSTEFRGAQNAPGPLNGGTNLFVESTPPKTASASEQAENSSKSVSLRAPISAERLFFSLPLTARPVTPAPATNPEHLR